jgi:very-short-patch-repair endonuclease
MSWSLIVLAVSLALLSYIYWSLFLAVRDSKLETRTNFDVPPFEGDPYRAVETLLTPAELTFFKQLRYAVMNDFGVSVKVRLSDVVDCAAHLSNEQRRSMGSQISRLHLDFVLFGVSSGDIALAIELDDRSHESAKSQANDLIKDRALLTAGVPLLRVKNDRSYNSVEIGVVVRSTLKDWKLVQRLNQSSKSELS